MRKLLLLSLLILCLMLPHADAQLAVFDGANFGANSNTSTQSTISAVQNVIQAVEAVFNSAQWVLELTPLDGIDISSDYNDTMAELGALAEEGRGLMGDAQSAQRQIALLFGLDTAPRTPVELQQRMNDIQTVVMEARTYAVRVQTLVKNLSSAATHLQNIVGLIGDITGGKQGHQTQHQLLATANATLAAQQAQAAAYQRAQVLQQAARTLVAESFNRIEADRWRGWPTW